MNEFRGLYSYCFSAGHVNMIIEITWTKDEVMPHKSHSETANIGQSAAT